MLELARPSDREAVNALAQQVHEMHISWRPDLYCTTPELMDEDFFQEAILSRSLYVARLHGVLVGYVLMRIRRIGGPGNVPHKVMALEQFCVAEGCRGQGIGTAMMEDVWALSKAFGCDAMELSVYPQNDEAVSFYQKCGFQIRNIHMQRKV